MNNLVELVVAITLASILSHVSLLLLLGRHDEVYRGLDRLTNSMAGGGGTPLCDTRMTTDQQYPSTCYTPRLAYPLFDDRPTDIPQALPANGNGWGAPLSWQNPGSADVVEQNRRRQAQPQSRGGPGHNFTNNYYLGQ